MSDLLTLAASGLRGYRAALEATAENVANANSPGFARREVELRALVPGSGLPFERPTATGLGVDVSGLRRMHDAFLAADARAAGAERSRLEAQRAWLAEIEAALAQGQASVGRGIAAFYTAAQAVADDPGSAVERALFLRAADDAAGRFRTAAADLDTVGAALGRELDFQVGEVNALTRELARVNDRLRRTQEGGAASAGLKDERDRLLAELSRFARIDVREGYRGQAFVRLGDAFGPVLVAGGEATRLAAAADGPGPTVRLSKGGADVATSLLAGSLAGLVEAGRQLGRAGTVLDSLAGDFAAAINAAHALGVDLAGAPGEALFATQSVAVTASRANVGTAAIATELADGAPLDPDGYRLTFDGTSGQWVLARRDGSASVTGSGPLTLDGLTVTPTGLAADADTFLIDPRGGAAGLSLRLAEPGKVAAAAPWIAGPAFGNAGSGAIRVTPDSSAALPVLGEYRIVFVTVSDFEIQDAAGTVLVPAQPYTPGMTVAGAGFSFTLSGLPALGDSFTIAAAADATGNAEALRGLIATRRAPFGTATFEERWDRETGRLATRLADARTGLTAAQAAEAAAIAAREARSGVDLDTEAASLIRFQQAYQASAQVVAAARSVFESLLAIR
ncbi:MAG: FlgK family flagellar hook-associated protein [Sphingomonadaceae bacterium]